jgi:hypothetical protein
MGKTRQSANLVSDNNIFVDIENDRVGIGSTLPTSKLDISGEVSVDGAITASSFFGDGENLTNIVASYATSSGIATYAETSGVSTVSQGLTGTPNITVGFATISNNLNVLGITTSNQTRFLSVAEKLVRIDGNTVSIAYTTTGANVGYCTNPSGNITLAVTEIPTDSSLDNHIISFSVVVNQTGTARSCTDVTMNGVTKTIKWAGGSLESAIVGVTTTNGYDIYSFTGINTVGSANTTDNYEILGVVNGGFR